MRPKLTRGVLSFTVVSLLALVFVTVRYTDRKRIPVHRSLLFAINYNSSVYDLWTEVNTGSPPKVRATNWTENVEDSLNQLEVAASSLKQAPYTQNKIGSPSQQKDTYTFGPYAGKYFESICNHSKEQVIECSKVSSRPLTPLEAAGGDILFTVRTAAKYHTTRLPEILDTWLTSVDPRSVYIVSDESDKDLEKKLELIGMSYVVSPQGSTHSREDLCSKSGAGMEILLRPENSKYNWMCHTDDDIYVNVESLVRALSHFNPSQHRVYFGRALHANHKVKKQSKIGKPGTSFAFAAGGCYCLSRPMLEVARPYIVGAEAFRESCVRSLFNDDITLGLIIGAILKEKLKKTNLMYMHHSMQELNKKVPPDHYKDQIALTYGDGSVKWSKSQNVIDVPGSMFSIKEDRSQFRSLHCYLHPTLQWCLDRRELIGAKDKPKNGDKL